MVISDEYYKKHAPQYRKHLKPTKLQLKKYPNVQYLVQYGDNEPTMVFGPDLTWEERNRVYKKKRSEKALKSLLKQTKMEIKDGKQKKVSSFFQK